MLLLLVVGPEARQEPLGARGLAPGPGLCVECPVCWHRERGWAPMALGAHK